MSLFKKRKFVPVEAEQNFSEWSIATVMNDGSLMELGGSVYGGVDPDEALRYVTALRDGLRAAGFTAELTLTRKSVEVKP